jgi:hypothetical protein
MELYLRSGTVIEDAVMGEWLLNLPIPWMTLVGPIEWAAILLMGLCMLIAIAIVHSDNRSTCAITVALFATTIALSALLIAAYSRPFSGAISVGPELLKQIPSYAGTRSAEGGH